LNVQKTMTAITVSCSGMVTIKTLER